MRLPPPYREGLIDDAEFSACGTYRYWLTRENLIPDNHHTMIVIGANPSTATATEPDRTIDKEIKFARSWKFGRLLKLNAQAFCTKDPAVMWRAGATGIDIVGPENDAHIIEAITFVPAIVMVAWGKISTPARVARIVELLGSIAIYCWKQNQDGSPTHPLYQPDTTQPRPWRQP